MMMDFPLITLKETDSTSRYLNDWCIERHDEVEPFTMVLADYQSAGKGQRGNSWESEAGKNLTFSFVIYPDFLPAKRQFLISQLISLGIVEALRKYEDNEESGFSVKWPNDIYYQDKKICGMLIETFLQGMNLGRCICGIGINVNQEQFLSDAPNPISLYQIIGKQIERNELLNIVMHEIVSFYDMLQKDEALASAELIKRYTANLYRKEGFHHYKDAEGEFLARFVKVEPDGRLFLEDTEGRMRNYLFKEVQYIV